MSFVFSLVFSFVVASYILLTGTNGDWFSGTTGSGGGRGSRRPTGFCGKRKVLSYPVGVHIGV